MVSSTTAEQQVFITPDGNMVAERDTSQCNSYLRSIHDTLDIISGKWKVTIMGSLTFGKKRFMELQRDVEGIGAKMLSKELRELEINGLVKRTVYDTKPVTVEYEITEYGMTLQPIIFEISKWGKTHRKKIMSKDKPLHS